MQIGVRALGRPHAGQEARWSHLQPMEGGALYLLSSIVPSQVSPTVFPMPSHLQSLLSQPSPLNHHFG
ncbi:hypothetical protein BC938DRAFT_480861 [Jimgerdemannia flammicorona]|uniref:Uncharacterized protein n=1 Tax=Jimgerdemannia flammicorona TaxID=994334 RepID=A0A433QHJ1_9FUNG|nr:hypothetical protein BC938DRAFT_480861 [Jimgerdemannia flammicorona]